MKSGSSFGRRLAAALITISCVACVPDEPTSPETMASVDLREYWYVGEPASYTGELERGVFKICTSRIASPGLYGYQVRGFSHKNADFVDVVGTIPGECVIANASKSSNGNKSVFDSVRVTYAYTYLVGQLNPTYLTGDGIVRIDSSCSVECQVSGIPTTVLLSGKEGAIAKFYFVRPGGVGTIGNHGGTGTIDFAID
jgi:hypothetical protein